MGIGVSVSVGADFSVCWCCFGVAVFVLFGLFNQLVLVLWVRVYVLVLVFVLKNVGTGVGVSFCIVWRWYGRW